MQVNGLRLLAANPAFDIEFYDESVRTAIDSQNAAYVKSQIREKIRRASVTVCLITEHTYTSAWVNWEVETSIEEGNRVILMALPGSPGMLVIPAAAWSRQIPWHAWDVAALQRLIDA